MKTSWHRAGRWYGQIVGEKGHYYHQKVVIPGVLRLLDLKKGSSLLDVGCGNGVLARNIDEGITYVGVDAAKSLIEQAERLDRNREHRYLLADVTRSIPVSETFSRAAIVLALQNIKEPEKTIALTSEKLASGARLVVVLNHPSFRIPRQSSWEVDEKSKMQYRRVNRYLSALEVPINVHPGEKRGPITWSYHHPLQDYSEYLYRNGLVIEKIEEWVSDKNSDGGSAKMENRARGEFPMFLAISAIKR